MRRLFATTLTAIACIVGCYGGELLPPADDDVPAPARDADTADATDASVDAAVAEGGSDAAPCSGPCSRYVFVTSVVRKGEFGGTAAADAICAQAAAAGDVRLRGRTFRAWLSQAPTWAISRLTATTDAKYARLDGEVVATKVVDFADGTIDAPIDVDENGVRRPGSNVWTGSSSTGAAMPNDCASWNTNATGATGTAGSTAYEDGRWSQHVDLQCNQEARFYCIED